MQKRCAPGAPEYSELYSGLGVGTGSRKRRGLKASSALLKGCNGDCAALGAGICLRQLIEETSYLHLYDETSVNGVLGGQMVRFEHKKKKKNI